MKHIKQFEELGFDDQMIKSKWDENIEKQKQEQDRRENDDHRSYFSIDDLDGLKKELNKIKGKLDFDKQYLFKMNKDILFKINGLNQNISEMIKLYLFENKEEWQSEFDFDLSLFHEYEIHFNIVQNNIAFNVIHITADVGNFELDLEDFIEFYNVHLSHKLV
jgi:hypothetical protein